MALLASLMALALAAQAPLERIEAHLVLKDPAGALQLVDAQLAEQPNDPTLVRAQMRALAMEGDSRPLLRRWQSLPTELAQESDMVELVSWTLLREGCASPVVSIRLAALKAAASTRDIWAGPLLVEAMGDSNDQVRAAAAQLALQASTGPVRASLLHLLAYEKRPEVWMTAAQVAGMMQLRAALPYLEQRIADGRAAARERAVAIQSLVRMKDRVDRAELERCAKSPRAGLRQLACSLMATLAAKEDASVIEPLLSDPVPDVRATALTALGLASDLKASQVEPMAQDPDPIVAITAGWWLLLHNHPDGAATLRQWTNHSEPGCRRLAAAAVAHAGTAGLSLAKELLDHAEPAVRLQAARTLLHHRTHLTHAIPALAQLLTDSSTRWAWDEGAHPLFRPVAPAETVATQIEPGFLERSDARVRLELWQDLAQLDHPDALTWVRQVLVSRDPSLTAQALEILMEEEPRALDTIKPLLSDPEPRVRMVAALLCALLARDPTVIPILQELFPKSPRPLQLAALEAMAVLGEPDALAFLKERLHDPSQLTRLMAASATMRCLNQ
jgi:HEAT repeat protein